MRKKESSTGMDIKGWRDPAMNCRTCGRPIPGDSEFCQYCGCSITGRQRPAQHHAQTKSSMSTGTIIAIVVALAVVVPIVLSAILYSLVLGFGGTHADTPSSMLAKSEVTNGFRFTFGAVSATNIYWSDVTIVLGDGVQTCEWQPSTDSLDEGSLDTQSFGIVPLGALMIYCNVTDLAGDGHVSYGDYFTLTTPSTSPFNVTTNYTVTILFELSGGCVCRSDFSG